MLPAADSMLLGLAGLVAGVIGTAGAITSLISYPALLAVGVAPLPDSPTNIVAVVACLPGVALASGPELEGRWTWLRRRAPLAMAGGAVGAALLLLTPPGVFTRVVPFLLVIAALALLVQPRLSAWRERHPIRFQQSLLAGGVIVTSLTTATSVPEPA